MEGVEIFFLKWRCHGDEIDMSLQVLEGKTDIKLIKRLMMLMNCTYGLERIESI